MFLLFNFTINTYILKSVYEIILTPHICGYKKIDLSLSDRTWLCPICNTTHNRDHNASINILNEGLRSLSLGTNDYTDGATYNSSMMVSEPIFKYLDEVAVKSEATKS